MLEKNNSPEPTQTKFRDFYNKLMNLSFDHEGITHTFHFVPDDFSDDGVSSQLFNEILAHIANVTGRDKDTVSGDYLNVDDIARALNASQGLSFAYLLCTAFERSEAITSRWTTRAQEKPADNPLAEDIESEL